MGDVTEGRFTTGQPYLKVGHGPPLIVMPGLSPDHANPTGNGRTRSLRWAAPFADHFTVYLTPRRPGLAPGTTMSDIAADYARVITHDLGEPAAIHGTSTGGSVALQLAVDSPVLVTRLVVAASACRLSPYGRALQLEVGEAVRAGDWRRAGVLMAGSLAPGVLRYPARGVGWLLGGMFAREDSADMLATIAAEDAFDVESSLDRVTAPSVVLGGTADPFYSEDLFLRTAEGIPRGHAVLFPGKAHAYTAAAKTPAAIALGFLIG